MQWVLGPLKITEISLKSRKFVFFGLKSRNFGQKGTKLPVFTVFWAKFRVFWLILRYFTTFSSKIWPVASKKQLIWVLEAGPFLFLIFWGSDNQETDQNIVDINACELQVDKI